MKKQCQRLRGGLGNKTIHVHDRMVGYNLKVREKRHTCVKGHISVLDTMHTPSNICYACHFHGKAFCFTPIWQGHDEELSAQAHSANVDLNYTTRKPSRGALLKYEMFPEIWRTQNLMPVIPGHQTKSHSALWHFATFTNTSYHSLYHNSAVMTND